jgi:hypothetical protein
MLTMTHVFSCDESTCSATVRLNDMPGSEEIQLLPSSWCALKLDGFTLRHFCTEGCLRDWLERRWEHLGEQR